MIGILIRPQPIIEIKGFIVHGPAQEWTEFLNKFSCIIVYITFTCTFFCIIYQFCAKYKHLCTLSWLKSVDFLIFMVPILINICVIIVIAIVMVQCLYKIDPDEILEKQLVDYIKHENNSSLHIFGLKTSGTINYHHFIYLNLSLFFLYLVGLILISIGILSELGKFNYFKAPFSLLKNGSAVQTLFIEAFFTIMFLTSCCIVMYLEHIWDDLHEHLWMSYLINKLFIIFWLLYTIIIPAYLIKTHFLDRYQIRLNVFKKWRRKSQ